MNTPTLKTTRLILRRFTEKDIKALFLILKDIEVNKFLPWYPLKDIEEAKLFYEEKYAAKEWAQMLEPLDPKYRMVILLYYMEGFNIREISDILDMKESTVKSRLQRGRKQVAELYEYKVREGRA